MRYGPLLRVGSSHGRVADFISVVFRCHNVGCAASKVRRVICPLGARSAVRKIVARLYLAGEVRSRSAPGFAS